MNMMPPVFDPIDVDNTVIEDIRTAASEFYSAFGPKDAYDSLMADPERSAYIDATRRGQKNGAEVMRNLVRWFLRPWHSCGVFQRGLIPRQPAA